MIVYLVQGYEYDYHSNYGIYLSEEKALEEFTKLYQEDEEKLDHYIIEKVDTDTQEFTTIWLYNVNSLDEKKLFNESEINT